MAELNKLLANEERLVVSLTYAEASATHVVLNQVHDQLLSVSNGLGHDINEVGREMKSLTMHVQNDRQETLEQRQLDHLKSVLHSKAVSYTDEWYSILKGSMLRGSAAWLQDESLFQYWIDHQVPVLWVFGGPGAGKSMLACWLITHLVSQYNSTSDLSGETSVGYFFVKENREELRTPSSIFRTLAWQLQEHDEAFRKHAVVACKSSSSIARVQDLWENLFLKFFQGDLPSAQGHRTILIIDGLDEADSSARQDVLRLMKEYVKRVRRGYPHRVQFAVFGRGTLRSDLTSVEFDHEDKIIEVSEKNKDDLREYIKYRLSGLNVIRTMRANTRAGGLKKAKAFESEIGKLVLEGADGVFLWVLWSRALGLFRLTDT